jgi:uncharacterized protein YraI
MRGMTAIFLCGSVLGAMAHGADRTFPYTAQISVDEVEVRCGPGWDYYATQRLPRGTRVEVYRHESGGWLAIRPPEGSFSWVTARHVKATPDKNVAEVVLDAAVAWVGSSTTNVPQHKWQVRLERGERVEVLGELAMTVGPGFATETYHKIAAPAGEFRWIHAEHAVSPNTAAQETVSQSGSQNDYRHVGGPTASAPADSPSAVKAALSAPELAKQVEELHIALSLLVTREIEQWDLDSLKQRADALAQQAADTKLSQEINAISQRMRDFETLRRRYQKAQEPDVSNHQVGGKGAGNNNDGNNNDGNDGDANSEIEKHGVSAAPRLLQNDWARDIDAAIGPEVTQTAAASGDSRYDAEGWLMPVHSAKRVAPPFAVLDDDGRVRAYVTPVPGLNLRRYAKQYVGLVGDRRYVDTLRAPHITAERVVKQKRERVISDEARSTNE